MSEKDIKNYAKNLKDNDPVWKKSMTEEQWHRFSNMKDEDIDTSDIPELDEEFWQNAKIVMPKNKKAISIRLDEDMLNWFKEKGKGYQSLINSVLRSYYESHLQEN